MPAWPWAADPDGLPSPIEPLEMDSHGQLVGLVDLNALQPHGPTSTSGRPNPPLTPPPRQGSCRLW